MTKLHANFEDFSKSFQDHQLFKSKYSHKCMKSIISANHTSFPTEGPISAPEGISARWVLQNRSKLVGTPSLSRHVKAVKLSWLK